MHSNIERVIHDNPNLSHAVLARFLGMTTKQVFTYRRKNKLSPTWFHKGKSIPFTYCFIVDSSTIAWRIECKSKNIFCSSNFDNVMINLDRLIYCLDNNNGKLPPSEQESYFSGLNFIKRDKHHSN